MAEGQEPIFNNSLATQITFNAPNKFRSHRPKPYDRNDAAVPTM
jgi:hypothetical protein